MNDFDWNLPRVLEVVAREGSLSRAASALGSSQPTVGRQIAALEEALGVALIVRSPRGVTLTAQGRAVAGAAERISAEIGRLERQVTAVDAPLSGTVRLSASQMVGIYLLPPILARLRRVHPLLALDLVLEDKPADLLGGDVDVAVRMFRPTQLDLVAKKVGEVGFGLFASAAYLEAHGPFTTMDDLLDGHLIGYDRDPWLRGAYALVDPRLRREHFGVRTDNQMAHVEAARGGLGVAALQVGIAARFPELVPIGLELTLPPMAVWVVVHSDLKAAAATRAVFEGLSDGLREMLGEGGCRGRVI